MYTPFGFGREPFSCLPVPQISSSQGLLNKHPDDLKGASEQKTRVIPIDSDDVIQMQLSIMDLVESSCLAAKSRQRDVEQALVRAREALELLNKLKIMIAKRQDSDSQSDSADQRSRQLMTRSVNMFHLEIMLTSNLAERLKEAGQLKAACDLYTRLCKHSPGTSKVSNQSSEVNLMQRFGLNLGNICFLMGDFSRALKYYRLTLDRIRTNSSANDYRQLNLKLNHNIAVTLRRMGQLTGAISCLERLLSDNLSHEKENGKQESVCIINANHHDLFARNLILCHKELSTKTMSNTLLSLLKQLVRIPLSKHYERIGFEYEKEWTESMLGALKDSTTALNNDPGLRNKRSSSNQTDSSIKSTEIDRRDRLKTLSSEVFTKRNNDNLTTIDGLLTSLSGNSASSNNPANAIDQTKSSISSSSSSRLIPGNDLQNDDEARSSTSSTRGDKLDVVINRKLLSISRSLVGSFNLLLLDESHLWSARESRTRLSSLNICLAILNSPESEWKSVAADLLLDHSMRWLHSTDWSRLTYSIEALKHVVVLTLHQLLTSSNRSNEDQPNISDMHHSVTSGRMGHGKPAIYSPELCLRLSLVSLVAGQIKVAIKFSELAGIDDLDYDHDKISSREYLKRLYLATAYRQLGNTKLAEQMYLRAQSLKPTDWCVAYNLAQFECLKLGQPVSILSQETRSALAIDDRKLADLVAKRMVLSSILLARLKSGPTSGGGGGVKKRR